MKIAGCQACGLHKNGCEVLQATTQLQTKRGVVGEHAEPWGPLLSVQRRENRSTRTAPLNIVRGRFDAASDLGLYDEVSSSDTASALPEKP